MKYDIKAAKEAVLLDAITAYDQIWQTDGIDTSLEEELMLNAVFKILDKDTSSREQFEELLGISYMLQGIEDRLRQLCRVREAENEPEEDITEENGIDRDEQYPF